MPTERLKTLIALYLDKTINDVQLHELSQWVTLYSSDEELVQLLKQAWHTHQEQDIMPDLESDRIIAAILDPASSPIINLSANNVISINTQVVWLKRFAVAASILIIFSIGYFKLKPTNTQPSVINTAQVTPPNKDIEPGRQMALLTLSDGSQIILDSATNGVLSQQGNAKVIKLANGQLQYTSNNSVSSETVFNTMTTPAGGQYQLTLPEGSVVWLNASSSIHYPTAFTENERRVSITGEAYFEIAKDAHKPFIVKINDGTEVKVLGTHFNVNAYADEEEIKTTLLEGSINISSGSKNTLLKPGNQAKIDKTGKLNLLLEADVEEAVAWKNGNFQFKGADLSTVLRQAARWYDLEVVYTGKPSNENKFTGKIPRTVNLSRLLKWLELSDVHFKQEGNKITIIP